MTRRTFSLVAMIAFTLTISHLKTNLRTSPLAVYVRGKEGYQEAPPGVRQGWQGGLMRGGGVSQALG